MKTIPEITIENGYDVLSKMTEGEFTELLVFYRLNGMGEATLNIIRTLRRYPLGETSLGKSPGMKKINRKIERYGRPNAKS
jgi:hypothetical protein